MQLAIQTLVTPQMCWRLLSWLAAHSAMFSLLLGFKAVLSLRQGCAAQAGLELLSHFSTPPSCLGCGEYGRALPRPAFVYIFSRVIRYTRSPSEANFLSFCGFVVVLFVYLLLRQGLTV